MKTNKVYTRTGDQGTTSLIGGIRVRKSSERIEAYGTVDELNAHLGLLATYVKADDNEMIERIQNNLFNIGAYLATDQNKTPLYESARFNAAEVQHLETEIDTITDMLPVQSSFILPGGCEEAAQAHVCRTVCRRAERCVVSLAETIGIEPEILQYFNRISDYLYVLARKLNFINNIGEKKWQNVCK
jgi:cob(I)alamin adenosyltransferase